MDATHVEAMMIDIGDGTCDMEKSTAVEAKGEEVNDGIAPEKAAQAEAVAAPWTR